jgi:hypothetical protein
MRKLPERRDYFQPKVTRCGRLQRPQRPQDIPRVLEIAKKFGLEPLPPRGA